MSPTLFQASVFKPLRGRQYADTLFYRSLYGVGTTSVVPVQAVLLNSNNTLRLLGDESWYPSSGGLTETTRVVQLWSDQTRRMTPVFTLTPTVATVPSLQMGDWCILPSTDGLSFQYQGRTAMTVTPRRPPT